MFDRLRDWWNNDEQAAINQQLGHPSAGVIGWFDPGTNTSGVSVDENTALTYSAVWAATRVISETVASLPCFLYERRSDGGRERALDDSRFGLVHDSPNDVMTPYSYFETVTAHMVLWGNGYSRITRSGGVASSFEIRLPETVRIEPTGEGVLYHVDSLEETISADDMIHVAGLGHDGVRGYSVVRQAAQSIGSAMAAEKYAGAFYGSGAQPAGALIHPNRLSKEHREQFRRQWNEVHQGPDNANKIAVLHGGMEYKQLGLSNEDAQFLESRQFNVAEIARWFRLPPHTLADLSHATFSNIEQQALEFVKYSITPWLRRWETTLNKKLLRPNEQGRLYFEFLLDSLLRGDIESRYNAFATARQWGWMNADEIRAMENMNPLPDGIGQTYLHPLNMAPADSIPDTLSDDFQRSLAANLDTVLKSQQVFAERLTETGSVVHAVRDTEEALMRQLSSSHADQRQMREEIVNLGKRVQGNGHVPRQNTLVQELAVMWYGEKVEQVISQERRTVIRLAKRCVNTGANFLNSVENYYSEREKPYREIFRPVVEIWCSASGKDADVELYLCRLVSDHIARSTADLLKASETDLERLVESVQAAVAAWSDRIDQATLE